MAVPLLLVLELWMREYPKNLHLFSMSFTPAICLLLFRRVSLKNTISEPDLVIAINFAWVFFPGLAMFKEHTFWLEKLILGNFFRFGGAKPTGALGIIHGIIYTII